MFELEVVDPNFLPHIGCDVRLKLGPKQGLVITGPNGLGKSTFLRALRKKHEHTYVGQATLDFFYDRKVGEVRRLLMSARGEQIPRDHLDALWETLGLTGKEGRQLSALSGGELQSLKLVLNLAKKSYLFLLDEPFQSLDQGRKEALARVLDYLRKTGASLLVVEHDLSVFPSGWSAVALEEVDGKLVKGREWTI